MIKSAGAPPTDAPRRVPRRPQLRLHPRPERRQRLRQGDRRGDKNSTAQAKTFLTSGVAEFKRGSAQLSKAYNGARRHSAARQLQGLDRTA